ncbi:MAG: thiamine-phosphate kinase [Acidobacteria bacterium]|nr:thiamine-phosphate kinase [Acidobacteriota bacterium]
MNELDLVAWVRRQARGRRPGLAAGIGDDCAIYRPRGASVDLLLTTDMLIEDVHFRRGQPAERLGHNVLARGLSDIAAMGGDPRICLLSLAVPEWADEAWVKRFYRGLLKLARETGTVLAGGDLARAGKLAGDIVVCGEAPRGEALRRDRARRVDDIFVSGPLGGAAARGYADAIQPRLEFGRTLRGRARAAMDVSDGLALDLHRLCLASGVAAELDEVPMAPGATLDQALHGGEDYELLFTARAAVPGAIRIGRIVNGPAGEVRFRGERLEPRGYDHFSRR